ncbi:MAG TPA: aminotransferase class IV, partial [Candidatus Eisenbacteria bacterium]|nr:aminotransferase class IV [Candidatus Eisenbacteria bacterium]
LVTPDLACAILPGTTRSWIVVWGTRAGLDVAETWLTTRDLADADEAFLCSSVAGILPVTRFEGRAIGTGLPGPWTRRARADREAYIVAGDSAAAAAVERGEAANRAADAGQPAGRAAAEPRHVAGG